MSEKIENRDFIVLTREALSQNQTVTFKVKGVSMWPFYKDQITSVTLKMKEIYQKLDVVLAIYEERLVLHRIIKINGDIYTLRGDGAYLKETVSSKDIIGYVVSHQHKKVILETNCYYRLMTILWVYNPIRKLMIKMLRKRK